VVGVVVVLACAGTAAAQQATDPGFYVGARVGSARIITPTRDWDGGGFAGYDQDTITLSFFGGREWRVGPIHLGGEIGYSDNGSAALNYVMPATYEFKSTQFDFLGSFAVVRGRLALGLKAGVGRTHEQYRLSDAGGATPGVVSELTKNLPVAALTFGYGLGTRVTFCLDFRRTFGDAADTVAKAFVNPPRPARGTEVLSSVSQVTVLSAGLRVRF